jgi:hypothetical protein
LPTDTPLPTNTPEPTQTPIPPSATIPPPSPTEALPVPQSKADVVEIENNLYARITSEGAGDRFVIKDSTLAGSDLVEGGLTFSESADGQVQISTEFPGDVMPLPNVYGQRVWRFRGKAFMDIQKLTGEVVRYTFVGESDDLNLLTFGRFPDIGFVYLRGKGTVIFPDGQEAKVGY